MSWIVVQEPDALGFSGADAESLAASLRLAMPDQEVSIQPRERVHYFRLPPDIESTVVTVPWETLAGPVGNRCLEHDSGLVGPGDQVSSGAKTIRVPPGEATRAPARSPDLRS
jgi:hypothetical protein